MKRKTKADTYRQEYFRIRRSAERFIKDATSRGYSMPELPKVPKTITKKSVESLRRRTERSELYKKSTYTYIDSKTGEIRNISGERGKSVERSKAAKKAAETRKKKKTEEIIEYGGVIDYSIVDKIYELLDEIDDRPRPDRKGNWHSELFYEKNDLIKSFDSKIDEAYNSGEYDDYIEYLHKNESFIAVAVNKTNEAYYHEEALYEIGKLFTLLMDRPLTITEAKRIGETSDYYSYTPSDENQ